VVSSEGDDLTEEAAITIPGVTLSRAPVFRDERGTLGVTDFSEIVPFEPVRMFWLADVPAGGQRGGHAHRACSQFMICSQGQIRVAVTNGHASQDIVLSLGDCLMVGPGIYATETFEAAGSVLVVLCDRHYEADDYIYDLGSLSKAR